MVKFSIGTIIPENEGWVWSTESISEAKPRQVFVKLACASGVVDMSRVAAGKLLYDDRTISVTFARFNRQPDYWLTEVQTLTNKITQAFESALNNELTIGTKTNPDMAYIAYAWDYSVSRDGIIQFVTINFKVKPLNLYAYTKTMTIAHDELELLQSEADNATMKITIRDVHVYNSSMVEVSKTVNIYDDGGYLVRSGTPAQFKTIPWEVDMSSDPYLQFQITVTDLNSWTVTMSFTKEEI